MKHHKYLKLIRLAHSLQPLDIIDVARAQYVFQVKIQASLLLNCIIKRFDLHYLPHLRNLLTPGFKCTS
jgi:hypothetical protein